MNREWTAKWIGPENEDTFLPVLFKDFYIDDRIKKATLYIAATGLFEAYINGRRVGDEYLLPYPGKTKSEIPYFVYDVTDYLNSGRGSEVNSVDVFLGPGWESNDLPYALKAEFEVEVYKESEEEVDLGETDDLTADDPSTDDLMDVDFLDELDFEEESALSDQPSASGKIFLLARKGAHRSKPVKSPFALGDLDELDDFLAGVIDTTVAEEADEEGEPNAPSVYQRPVTREKRRKPMFYTLGDSEFADADGSDTPSEAADKEADEKNNICLKESEELSESLEEPETFPESADEEAEAFPECVDEESEVLSDNKEVPEAFPESAEEEPEVFSDNEEEPEAFPADAEEEPEVLSESIEESESLSEIIEEEPVAAEESAEKEPAAEEETATVEEGSIASGGSAGKEPAAEDELEIFDFEDWDETDAPEIQTDETGGATRQPDINLHVSPYQITEEQIEGMFADQPDGGKLEAAVPEETIGAGEAEELPDEAVLEEAEPEKETSTDEVEELVEDAAFWTELEEAEPEKETSTDEVEELVEDAAFWTKFEATDLEKEIGADEVEELSEETAFEETEPEGSTAEEEDRSIEEKKAELEAMLANFEFGSDLEEDQAGLEALLDELETETEAELWQQENEPVEMGQKTAESEFVFEVESEPAGTTDEELADLEALLDEIDLEEEISEENDTVGVPVWNEAEPATEGSYESEDLADEAEPVIEELSWDEEEPAAEEPAWDEEEPAAEEAFEPEELADEAEAGTEAEPVIEELSWDEEEPAAEEPAWDEEEPATEEPAWAEEEPATEEPAWAEEEPAAEEAFGPEELADEADPDTELEEEPFGKSPEWNETEPAAETPAWTAPAIAAGAALPAAAALGFASKAAADDQNPEEAEWNPEEAEQNPEEAEWDSEEAEWNPEEAEWNPEEAEWNPEEDEWNPEEDEWDPNEEEWNPTDDADAFAREFFGEGEEASRTEPETDTIRIVTDETWKYYASDIESSRPDSYEVFNRLLWDGVENPEKDVAVLEREIPLKKADHLPVVIKEELAVQEILYSQEGNPILDFGRSFAGFLTFRSTLPRGARARFTFAENREEGRLISADNNEGFFYVSDGVPEVVSSHFTSFIGRYVEIDGWEGELKPENFTASVLYADMERTGYAETSSEILNRKFEDFLWNQKRDSLMIPKDGTPEDVLAFSSGANYNMDTKDFLSAYLRELDAETLGDKGAFAADLIWNLYQMSGDEELLSEHYELLTFWVRRLNDLDAEREEKEYLYEPDPAEDIWLSMDDETETTFLASAYYYEAACIAGEAAAVLGKEQESYRFRRLAGRIKQAFLEEFFTASGRLAVDTQSAYILSLHLGLYIDKEKVKKALAVRMEKDGKRMLCGSAAAPYFCRTLAENGMADLAYDVLLDPEPSRFANEIGFLYYCVAGIRPLEPGFSAVKLMPLPNGKLRSCSCTYRSAYGDIVSEWNIGDDGSLAFHFEVPEGITARIALPYYPVCASNGNEVTVKHGTYDYAYMPSVTL